MKINLKKMLALGSLCAMAFATSLVHAAPPEITPTERARTILSLKQVGNSWGHIASIFNEEVSDKKWTAESVRSEWDSLCRRLALKNIMDKSLKEILWKTICTSEDRNGDKNWDTIKERFVAEVNEKIGISMNAIEATKLCSYYWENLYRGEDWTTQEDFQLIRLHKTYGSSWSTISSMIIGRSPNSIKNRWDFISKKRTNNTLNNNSTLPQSDIGKIFYSDTDFDTDEDEFASSMLEIE